MKYYRINFGQLGWGFNIGYFTTYAIDEKSLLQEFNKYEINCYIINIEIIE